MKIVKNQSACESQGVEPVPTQPGSKVEIAISTVGQTPVNAMRHNPEKGANGWYIWCGGEFSEEDGFFAEQGLNTGLLVLDNVHVADLFLFVAFVIVSAALAWRLGSGGFVTEEIPLYLSALFIPVYWGAVTVQKNRLKRRRVEDDDGS